MPIDNNARRHNAHYGGRQTLFRQTIGVPVRLVGLELERCFGIAYLEQTLSE